jgi:glycosyltransferase involved in cell wall biosynthesis
VSQFPDVDVVVPTRDRPELLRTTVRAILASDYPAALRVIVVHDQSTPDVTLETDTSLGVAGEHRRVLVVGNTRTPGLAGARNTGILAANADLVAFCDDDDTWLPKKLRHQVSALDEQPGAEFVCCGIDILFDGQSHPRTLARRSVTLEDLLRDRLTELHPSTFVMRRKAVIDGFGLVEEAIPGSYAEDYEFLLRAARSQPLVNVPEVGVQALWSGGSYFTARWQMIESALVWLLEHYPEFADVPAGRARVSGQIAFAAAAQKRRSEALGWAWRAFRDRPLEPRTYLAVGVASGVLSPDWVLRRLHATGRGL